MNEDNSANEKAIKMSGKQRRLVDSFGRGKLTLVVIITAVILLGGVWFISDLYGRFKLANRDYIRIVELKNLITYYDEVLTMSARMSAAAGDSSWERRYREFEPELDRAIKEATLLAPAHFMREQIHQTDEANAKLVSIENKAFELVRNGGLKAACALLADKEYDKQKNIYSQGVRRFASSLENYMEVKFEQLYVLLLTVVVLWILCISFLLCGIIYLLQRNSLNKQKGIGAKIEEQKKFLDNILQSLQHPFLVYDANDYTIQMANSAAYKGELPRGLKCHGAFLQKDESL